MLVDVEEEVADLRAKLAESKAEVEKLKGELSRQCGSWKAIRISTPLCHIEHTAVSYTHLTLPTILLV